jgi:sugar (pentulose or hexulose) kinase
MAAAINTPVSVMDTAGEGGAWGMAILSSYMLNKSENESLEDFLDDKVFKEVTAQEIYPDELDVKGFEAFIKRYKKGLVIEKAAAEHHSEEREELMC